MLDGSMVGKVAPCEGAIRLEVVGHDCCGRFGVLPSVVDPNRVKATYREGVLEIQLPKKEEAKPKEIKVEAA